MARENTGNTSYEAEIGVRGIGATKEAAFRQAALALALTHSIITGSVGKQAQTHVELLRKRRCVYKLVAGSRLIIPARNG